MSKLIEAVSLTKEYRSIAGVVRALQNVSLSIHPGDYISIVGPSGAGKSTLLHILGGLEPPTKGKMLFNKDNIYKFKDKKLSLWRSQHVGFVFQFYHLIEELNVLENIRLASILAKGNCPLKTIQELLKYLGIESKSKFFPSQLSGGERQKVAFARALAKDPEVILCDEPTGNLDRESQDKIVVLLDKLNQEKNKTIILVTHNLELAKRAKKTIAIKDGELSET
ncbi:MAG: ABC transporter ATP-binding protein [Candidatus Omnitrophica bacterium]|jgi:putative ABC transport system ATP-binding protein|nr:ABC transporter ATP-binding protein [Candidatus Omnitrophota bacterium]